MNNREYWNNQPCNIKHSDKPIGTFEFFNDITRKKYTVEPHIIDFAEFEKWKNKNVLEIGCGIGTDAIQFIYAGANYTGIDISDKSLELVKKRIMNYQWRATLIVANAEHLDRVLNRWDRFDLIYSFGVLHHTSNPSRIINLCGQFLTPNGRIKIMLYSKYSWKNLRIKLRLDQYEAQAGVPIANTYSFREIRKLLQNYEIISMHKTHIFPFQLEPYKEHKYKLLWYIDWMPVRLFRWLETKLGWHTLIEAKLK